MTTRIPARLALRSFRGKLTLSIALSFILLGAALVAVQLAILNQNIADTISISIGTGTTDQPVPNSTDDGGPIQTTAECVATSSSDDCSITIPDDTTDYGNTVARDVMGTFITWSLILLIIFAVIAALLAWVLTRSPARKISHITDLAVDISEHDLSRRINLAGPQDEITALGDQIDTMLARLETAFTSQDLFVANASHELRTPITAIRAALEAPLVQGRVPEDLQPSLQRALRSAGRMDELITALLLIARSRHLSPHEQEPVDLAGTVRESIEDANREAISLALSITSNIPERPVLIQGNAEALAIAVHNLIRNAIQHNREHGWISITLNEVDGHITLTISNSGDTYTGHDAAGLTRAFNRGSRTRLAGSSGTGLGLTIIDSIATAHDAQLTVRPGVPDGLTVALTFSTAGQDGEGDRDCGTDDGH